MLRLDVNGSEQDVLAKAVIDASGTYRAPNPLGANGQHALGERGLADHIFYGIPDVLGDVRARYAGRRVLVVGSGHSAMNVLLDLERLAEQEPATRILWAVRRASVEGVFGGGNRDQLPERGRLGARLRQLVTAGQLEVVEGFALSALTRTQPTASWRPTALGHSALLTRSSPRRVSVRISICCARCVSTSTRLSRVRARSRR